MTRRATVRASAGAVALVLALAGCSDDGSDTSSGESASATATESESGSEGQSSEPTEAAEEPADPREALARAVEATSAQESASVRLDVQSEVAGQSSSVTGEGVVSLGDEQRAELTLALPPESGGADVVVRVIGDVTYVQLPSGAETGLPPEFSGKFLKIDAGAADAGGFGDLGQLGGSAGGLSESLEQLRNAQSVERTGEGEVEGESVTLYTVTTATGTPESPAPAGVPETITYTVAVDDEDLLREIRSSVPVADPTGGGDPAAGGSADATFTVVEYGVPLDVQEPSPDEVVDLGQLAGGAVG